MKNELMTERLMQIILALKHDILNVCGKRHAILIALK